MKLHAHQNARFSPFTYSIGLETTVAAAEGALQSYPLPKPVREETFRTFLESLTFVHEASHVVQYVSTAYGLRTLRYTLILLNALSKKPGWQLPVLRSLMDQGNFTPEEMRVVDGSVLFVDAIDQFRLHYTKLEHKPGSEEQVYIFSEPWSPHFVVGGGTPEDPPDQRVEYLRKIGSYARNLPHVVFDTAKTAADLVVNVAALMETYALVAEWNHIYNAMPDDQERALAALPERPEYELLIDFALLLGVCPPERVIPTMTALIDASLMYDPFILYDVPWDVADKDGRFDRYPGATFIELCKAAKDVAPIRNLTDIVRFHNEVCKRAGLPDPQWMAEKSLETAERVINKTPGEEVLLHRALQAHRDALKIRCDRGSARFAFELPTTGTINQIVRAALPAISFFNAHTLQPDGFDPRKVDCASVHSILFQAVAHPTIQCPLKLGNPFKCHNAGTDTDTLCVWTDALGRSECLLDILEKDYDLMPGEG